MSVKNAKRRWRKASCNSPAMAHGEKIDATQHPGASQNDQPFVAARSLAMDFQQIFIHIFSPK